MKKNEVRLGQCYMAKVTNSVVPVRIDAVNRVSGWDAKNLATGRRVRIKSAAKLRRACTEADLAGFQRPAGQRAKVGDTSAAKPTRKAKSQTARDTRPPAAKVAKPAKPKRISGLTAAWMVLVDADAELGVNKIVAKAAERGWWKSDAKTPAATIYAAMIREIKTKGDKARFQRGAQRGTFRAICTPAQRRELVAETH